MQTMGAGRVTASNFKAIIKTKVEDSLRSLFKGCVTQKHAHFLAQLPHGGVSMKVKELIAFLLIFQWITAMSIASKVD